MNNTKTYLTVPYAEKDTAKSLGAKWDAGKKKWYAPNSLDITIFSKWASESDSTRTSKTKSRSTSIHKSTNNMTYAKDKSFVAYDGAQPPWD